MAESVSQTVKFGLFTSLTVIVTANLVCINLSRNNVPPSELYYSSTSVFLAEFMKIMLSLVLLFKDVGSVNKFLITLKTVSEC